MKMTIMSFQKLFKGILTQRKTLKAKKKRLDERTIVAAAFQGMALDAIGGSSGAKHHAKHLAILKGPKCDHILPLSDFDVCSGVFGSSASS